MTMLTFAGIFAVLWVLQMLLMWWQAKRFMAAVATLRDLGDVITGRHKRRGLRTYVAISVKDNRITGTQVLRGVTVFAKPAPEPLLVGVCVDDLVAGTVTGVHPRILAAAANAASMFIDHRDELSKADI